MKFFLKQYVTAFIFVEVIELLFNIINNETKEQFLLGIVTSILIALGIAIGLTIVKKNKKVISWINAISKRNKL